ncbi:MAG TPA: fibrobacter succinogenes major paralogous domain-containing protein [Bacteroidales bacterium]|nr:fibrobacter succinogenes major paralogous domain-containing protein [Bacteroidales bacterium]
MKKKNKILIYLLILMCISLIFTNSCKKKDDNNNSSEQVPVLTTTAVSIITKNTSICGGNITSDGKATITARGVCWSTGQNPTIADNKTTDGSGIGSFASTITGLSSSTKYYVRAYATNSLGTSYGNVISFTTNSTVIDYDGNVYNTITIGTQTWMKENLKVTHYCNGDIIPNDTNRVIWAGLSTGARCYYNNDSITYSVSYGALYNWYSLVDNRNLCPIGWHVPTIAEWGVLQNYLISIGYNYDGTSDHNAIAKALADTTNWNLSTNQGTPGNTDYPSYRNKSCFSALPGGERCEDGSFGGVGDAGRWWFANEVDATTASYFDISSGMAYPGGGNLSKHYGVSIRCVKN